MTTRHRFLRFIAVGVLGFGLQITLLVLAHAAGAHYLTATLVAVEVAVLHNFVWHDRWTWADRGRTLKAIMGRLGRFHLTNGVVSLTGSALVVAALTGGFGVSPIVANVAAVAACAILNYVSADRFVFLERAQ